MSKNRRNSGRFTSQIQREIYPIRSQNRRNLPNLWLPRQWQIGILIPSFAHINPLYKNTLIINTNSQIQRNFASFLSKKQKELWPFHFPNPKENLSHSVAKSKELCLYPPEKSRSLCPHALGQTSLDRGGSALYFHACSKSSSTTRFPLTVDGFAASSTVSRCNHVVPNCDFTSGDAKGSVAFGINSDLFVRIAAGSLHPTFTCVQLAHVYYFLSISLVRNQ